MNHKLYPLKFQPIYKERIWGGQKLARVLNKELNSNKIGESWEISDVEGDTSVVVNGHLKGASLKELQIQFEADLIGKKNQGIFKDKFPLLIKFIDAEQDLSIQLHPNDELAAKRHNSFGKTEMWYVMQTDKDANLIIGFNQAMDKRKCLENINKKTLPKVLNYEKVKEGDSFLINVGCVHAIGTGVLLVEIQQTSDVTYRLYDWDRVDNEGKSRDLHVDLALDAIDYNMKEEFRIDYDRNENQTNGMISCPYFTTNYLQLTKPIEKKNNQDSFIIYICVDGEANIESDEFTETIKKGETLLMPAAIKNYSINSNSVKLLEVYV